VVVVVEDEVVPLKKVSFSCDTDHVLSHLKFMPFHSLGPGWVLTSSLFDNVLWQLGVGSPFGSYCSC
jgi:hypothetical protein